MMNSLQNTNPFDHNTFIGYVAFVSPEIIKIHIPQAILVKQFYYSGLSLNPGLIGQIIAIESDEYGFLGIINEIYIPEKERMELNDQYVELLDIHPVAIVNILFSFNVFEWKVQKTANLFPTIGSKAYICPPNILSTFFKKYSLKEVNSDSELIEIATYLGNEETKISVSFQSVFNRHCAIVGTTGGGKSFTTSRLVEECLHHNKKFILIDPTGEFKKYDSKDTIIEVQLNTETYFHYSYLSISDIFILLRPSLQVQSPKLMEAIRSLKIVSRIEKQSDPDNNINIINGCILKEGKNKTAFIKYYQDNIMEIDSLNADFDILKLPNQLQNECVYDSDFNDSSKWGKKDDRAFDNCTSLILRLRNFLSNSTFSTILGFNKNKQSEHELIAKLESFLAGGKIGLRIGFEKVGYEFQVREIIANAIGRFLLDKARNLDFINNNMILFIDEAHQFLNKSVVNEYFEQMELNAFDLIAKECRKYGLSLTISTQMPRDIPVGTLSQFGTFIIHRLINENDKKVIENACSIFNKTMLNYLPNLGEGEAILFGVDFPSAQMLKIIKPEIEPRIERLS